MPIAHAIVTTGVRLQRPTAPERPGRLLLASDVRQRLAPIAEPEREPVLAAR